MTNQSTSTRPSPEFWFASDFLYTGSGSASCVDPQRVASGQAAVKFQQDGESRAAMQVERVVPDEHRRAFKPIGDRSCTTFSLEAENGRLTASGPLLYSPVEEYPPDRPAEIGLQLHFSHATFDAPGAGPPVYWVLPLTNFLSTFPDDPRAFEDHPLIFQRLIEGADQSPEASSRAVKVIAYKRDGRPEFIQPVPDYSERVQTLEQERGQAQITAVMIGEIGNHSIDEADIMKWFPLDILHVLSVATGIRIGSPWVEFRDVDGRLVRRLHINEHIYPFPLVYRRAIDPTIHTGLSRLLTCAFSAPDFGHIQLRATLKYLTLSRLDGLSIEDRLSHLFRALDGLCVDRGLKGASKPADLLSQDLAGKVTAIFAQAQKALSTLAKEVAGSEAQPILDKLAQQAASAKVIQTSFGKAFLDLLTAFDLHDGKILATHYAEHPRVDKRRWTEVLSYYRGITMHQGYFDFDARQHDLYDVMTIMRHLHDILLRIALKMLAYDGTYQPSVRSRATRASVNWVTSTTQPADLGYMTESPSVTP